MSFLTTGEIINNAWIYFANVGSTVATLTLNKRERARYFLQEIGQRAWALSDHWWRRGDGTSTLTAGDGFGTLPNNFGAVGQYMQVWLQNAQRPLNPMYINDLKQALQWNTGTTSTPLFWAVDQKTSSGLSKIYVYQKNGIQLTLTLLGYMRRCPDFVDYPLACTCASGSAGNVSGTIDYKVTFVTADGETEAGTVSNSIGVSGVQVELTEIPVSPCRSVTGRNIYRLDSGVYRLVAASPVIADNVTTTYTDDTADVSSNALAPTPAEAVTGPEQFPPDFIEAVLARGLMNMLGDNEGDPRTPLFTAEWEKSVRRMWADQRAAQNYPNTMPLYGGRSISTFGSWRYRTS